MTRFSRATSRLPDSELVQYFAHKAQPTLLRAGEALLVGGDPQISFVEKGWLQRVHAVERKAVAISANYVPGDFINLDVICEREPMGKIVSITEAKLYSISAVEVRNAMFKQPQLALDALQRSIADGDWLREAVAAIGQLRALERLIYFIGHTRRRQIAYGTVTLTDKKMLLPLTQVQLGSVLGMSPIHCNRKLRELREMELLEMRGQHIWFTDIAKFEKLFASLLP